MCCVSSETESVRRRVFETIRKRNRRSRLAIALLAMCVRCASATHCTAGDEPGHSNSAFPVQQAGGFGAGQASSPPGVAVQATHTEVQPQRQSAPVVEKSPPLPAPPHASLGSERTSSGPRTMGAIVTVVVSLAVVLGLFWACAWLMRRGLPSTSRRLPAEVVDVLGRAPLAGRQQMHVLRFGNKLLLVCISASGVDTLGEITDPAEIDRVAGLCEQQQPQSATTAFKQIFGQLAAERSPTKTLRRKSAVAEEAADV
jgi:flagellar biogenesis protein FliO